MDASIRISVAVCILLIGCSSSVQVGLANAPVLGGATPETRVHDVIANGHDACERSGFPPGEVLKGHIPPCVEKERLAAVPIVPWTPPTSNASTPDRLAVCPSTGPGMSGREVGMTAIALSSSSRELVCDEPW